MGDGGERRGSRRAERIIRTGHHWYGHLGRLGELCEELEWILTRNYRLDIVNTDHVFHDTLVDLSGSSRLIMLHRCLPLAYDNDPGVEAVQFESRAPRILREHRALVEALGNGQLRPPASCSSATTTTNPSATKMRRHWP